DAEQASEQRYAPAAQRDRTDELVAELRARLDDMRNERDRARTDAETWRAAFERELAQRALPAPSNDAQAPQATPTTAWQRFLRWRRAGEGDAARPTEKQRPEPDPALGRFYADVGIASVFLAAVYLICLLVLWSRL